MKKIMVFVLTIAVVLSMAACGGTGNSAETAGT